MDKVRIQRFDCNFGFGYSVGDVQKASVGHRNGGEIRTGMTHLIPWPRIIEI